MRTTANWLIVPLALVLLPSPASAQGEGWSRVRRLEPGDAIALTADGAERGEQLFVSANDQDVTTLSLDSKIPATVARTLRRLAAQHPTILDSASRGGTVVADGVRLSAEGVFATDRKVADLQQVVHTISRPTVSEISVRRQGRGFWGHLGVLGGYFVGAAAGSFGAGVVCRAAAGAQQCDTGAFLVGMVAGGVAGAAYGLHAARREVEEIVYRRPE